MRRFGAPLGGLLLSLIAAAPFGCAGNVTHTSVAGDARAIADFEGVWTANSSAGVVSFKVCENKSPPKITGGTCQTLHVVKTGSDDRDESVDLQPSGCGGCDYDVSAFLIGTVTLPNGSSAPVESVLTLTETNKPDLYDGNYRVVVRTLSVGPGEVQIDGALHGGVIDDATLFSSSTGTYPAADAGPALTDLSLNGLTFERTDAAACNE